MKKVLIIDNYDSFTYNLVQYVRESADVEINVCKNDAPQLADAPHYDCIIVSPGPGLPEESGNLMQCLNNPDSLPPVLGVCLGHQAIAEAFGGALKQLDQVYHGVSSSIQVSVSDYFLFRQVPMAFDAGRYHSWVVDPVSIENLELSVTCTDEKGNVMGLRHKKYPIHGVQFHPESVMTSNGRQIISNFLNTYLS